MTRCHAFMRALMLKPFTIDGTIPVGHPWHLGNALLFRNVETSAIPIYARACGRVAGVLARKAAYAKA